MMKFLRKYNKWFLVVGGSLLLVTWLGSGTASQFQPDPGKRIVATAQGQKIRASEMGHAELEHRALMEYAGGTMRIQVGIENASHWFLLAREATSAGFVGEAGDGASFVPELARLEAQMDLYSNPQFRGFADQLANSPQFMQPRITQMEETLTKFKATIAGRSNLNEVQMNEALAKLRGVLRMINTYSRAARMSDAHLTEEVMKFRTRVSVDGVIVPWDRAPSVAEPTEEKLKELFEAYKDVRAGEGEFGFGYKLPPRVKIEYLTISKADVLAAITLDPVAVSKHWQQNRETFKGEFAAEKMNVENALREREAGEVMAEADRIYRAKVKITTRRLETNAGIKKLPADWDTQRPRMEDIAKAIQAEVTRITMPLPKVEVLASKFTPVADFQSMGDLAFAQVRTGTFEGTTDQLLSQTFELSKSNTVGLQVGIPFDVPLTDTDGDKFYITVLDAKTENAPDTIDEVREQVLADAKKLAGYEKLKAEASTYLVTAASDGLEGIANLFAKTDTTGATDGALTIDRRMLISKMSGDQAYPRYESQALRDEVMNHVMAMGLTTKATPENFAQRVLTVPLPKEQGLAVLAITGFTPVSVEDMRTLSLQAANNLASRELIDLMRENKQDNPYSFAAIKERMTFADSEKPLEVTADKPQG